MIPLRMKRRNISSTLLEFSITHELHNFGVCISSGAVMAMNALNSTSSTLCCRDFPILQGSHVRAPRSAGTLALWQTERKACGSSKDWKITKTLHLPRSGTRHCSTRLRILVHAQLGSFYFVRLSPHFIHVNYMQSSKQLQVQDNDCGIARSSSFVY